MLNKTIDLAHQSVKAGNLLRARHLYGSVLDSFPDNTTAKIGLERINKYINSQKSTNLSKNLMHQLIEEYKCNNFSFVSAEAQKLVLQYPEDAQLWNILGAAAIQNREIAQAVHAFERLTQLEPNVASNFYNLGNAFRDAHLFDSAILAYLNALKLDPNYKNAANNLNILRNYHLSVKDIGSSKDTTEKKTDLKYNVSHQFFNMGVKAHKLGKFIDAETFYNRSLKLSPNDKDVLENLGAALHQQGKLEEAKEIYEKLLQIYPNNSLACNNLGLIYSDIWKLDSAREYFEMAIKLDPSNEEILNNLAIILRQKGLTVEALETFEKALAINPEHAEIHKNFSNALFDVGDIENALIHYEWRWKTNEFQSQRRKFLVPEWKGEQDVHEKTILLWSEQGIGDTIAWSYQLPKLETLFKKCILECPEKVVPLIQSSFPNTEVRCFSNTHEKKSKDFDFHLPFGSLYQQLFNIGLNEHSSMRFLHPEDERVNYWRARLKGLGDGPYIGISWKSGNMNFGRLPNYTSITDWLPLLSKDNYTFINLQYVDYEKDLLELKNKHGLYVHDFPELDHFNNLLDVAALCSALDLVVSVKNTVSIISSGVGTVTKLLNWKQSDWNNILHNPTGPKLEIYDRCITEPWVSVMQHVAEKISLDCRF